MLNKVLLIGHTTREIELRYLPSGSAVAKTGIAVNRVWKDKITGERKEEAMFIDIVIYGRVAEIANQYLTKGTKTLVEGRLVFEQWLDQNGQKRSRHIVAVESFELLGSKPNTETEAVQEASQPIQAEEVNQPTQTVELSQVVNQKPDIVLGDNGDNKEKSKSSLFDFSDDEIPF